MRGSRTTSTSLVPSADFPDKQAAQRERCILITTATLWSYCRYWRKRNLFTRVGIVPAKTYNLVTEHLNGPSIAYVSILGAGIDDPEFFPGGIQYYIA